MSNRNLSARKFRFHETQQLISLGVPKRYLDHNLDSLEHFEIIQCWLATRNLQRRGVETYRRGEKRIGVSACWVSALEWWGDGWWSVGLNLGFEFWRRLVTDCLMTASDVIQILDLKPHPEGGHYRETFRDPKSHSSRAVSTAIYFLLAAGEVSHWHRIDSTEVWHWYGGATLALSLSDGENNSSVHLGMNLSSGERPQAIAPPGTWQSARTLGPWTLVGCTVAPGFLFDHFELAPPGWEPGVCLA